MMDIVKWLREYGWRNGTKTCGDRHDEAAAEIELLRKERDGLREALKGLLACPAIADGNHNEPAWYDHETIVAEKLARSALKDGE